MKSFNDITLSVGAWILFYSKAGSGKKYGRQRFGRVVEVKDHALTVRVICQNNFDKIYFKVPVGEAMNIQVRKVKHAYVDVDPFSHVIVVPEEILPVMGLVEKAALILA